MRTVGTVAPLRRALATTTMMAVAAALALACGAFVAYEFVTFREGMARTLTTRAALLSRLVTSAVVFTDPESAASTLKALQAEPHILAAGVWDTQGSLFASYRRTDTPEGAVPRPVSAEAEGFAFEGNRLVAHKEIVADGARVGTLAIASDLDELYTRLRRYGVIALGVLLASFALAYGIAARLQRVIAVPVLRLAETAHAVSERRDYSVRAEAGPVGAELGQLVRAFNHMLVQIQERDAELLEARDGLERLVAERTRELQKEVADRRALAEVLEQTNRDLEQQSRRVQEATRLKSEFLANMSHELRTPLNAIIGFGELLHDGKVGTVSPDQEQCLADILTSANHLLQLINDVLDLSKVEAGKMEFHPEPLDAGKVVAEVRDILRGMAARKRIRVTTEIDETLGEVVADPGKLKQVLYNFLSNAIKFTPEAGTVVLRAAAEGPSTYRLEVEDSGIGIRTEDLPRLFVEFQQLETGSAKTHQGTGLGLALTKRMVEAQGGHVGVESVLGEGSRFFAVLPRLAKTGEATAPPPPPRPSAPAILVVEDDAAERAWLVGTLSSAGYEVASASTGHAALRLCAERAFAGITLDLFLSDTTGWDVLKEIRAGGLNQATPVIVVSVVSEKGLGAGFAIQDYLVKPVGADQLLSALRRSRVEPAGRRPILVVDDDAQALRLMETTLRGLDYDVVVVQRAEDGIAEATRQDLAAVILDLSMPGMDGFEFLARFRQTPAGRATPVIVWTARDLTREESGHLLRSVQGLVLKHGGGVAPLLEELRQQVPLPRVGVTKAP